MSSDVVEWTLNEGVDESPVVNAISGLTGATLGGLPGSAENKVFPGGFLRGWNINNPFGADIFVHIFGQPASTVVLGTTKPVLSLRVPANGTVEQERSIRLPLLSGFSMAATAGETGSTAPAGALNIRLAYEGG